MIANRPVVWTLLARAMSVADRELAQALNPGEQVIYVVSDGEEACGGDPFAAARRINQGTARAIVNIIGFGLSHNEATSLQTVAGAGTFVNLETKRDFDKTVAAVKESIRLAGNEVRASNAISANAVTTASVISKASLCISNIISSESNRVSNDLSARALRGKNDPPSRKFWTGSKRAIWTYRRVSRHSRTGLKLDEHALGLRLIERCRTQSSH
ncbi:Ca-activated chloride channel family protein [Ochrobactrum sp. J50]|nr:Ca-activated chloride channel family protein [Ochrobactrum sp. J50]